MDSIYQVNIEESDIEKTAFRTRHGHYEYTFMALMTNVFKEFLYKFVVVFVDDILIYNKLDAEHREHNIC